MLANDARRIVVVQRRLTHYRVPFFAALRDKLAEAGHRLVLAHGEPTAKEATKSDAGTLNWTVPLQTRYLIDGRICWQPFGALLKNADVVVVTAENKLLYNLYVQYRATSPRVCLWGHGANLQGDATSLRERFKRIVARRADWWFAYTDMSVPLIERSGFPSERVTVLNNAVDTTALCAMRSGVDTARLACLRAKLGLAGPRVGVYVGSLYAEKRIEFLLEAAKAIRLRVPDFELLVVGGGEQAGRVEQYCATNGWARYLGVRKGQDKVDLMALSRVTLNPGLVGLGILDTFACRTPMVTTDCGLHSPEIAYLEDGENGIMTPNSLPAYVDAACRVLTDDAVHARLVAGCISSSTHYSLGNMVSRFSDGIERCLAAPRYRGGAQ